MSYKTILVHVDQSKHVAARINIAANIATIENAHLIGAAMTGISRFLYRNNALDLTGDAISAQLDFLKKNADQALGQFNTMAQNLGVLSYEKRLVDDEAEVGLALQARYADIVIVGQTNPYEPPVSVMADLPEYVMLNCARPVLIIPHAGQFDIIGKNVLIAWDGSMEATRAITAAIPLLKRADKVTIALFNPNVFYDDVHGEEPGADIALYLTRHGIKINVTEQYSEMDIGNTLLSLAADLRTDLMVMGGYGHTRFRELILGGVTKMILKTMTVPVLMSH